MKRYWIYSPFETFLPLKSHPGVLGAKEVDGLLPEDGVSDAAGAGALHGGGGDHAERGVHEAEVLVAARNRVVYSTCIKL